MAFPKVSQLFSWDCGLACVDAIASSRGLRGLSTRSLAAAFPDQSVWTIDLAILLIERAAIPSSDVRFTTTCAGVNPAHAGKAFYSRIADDAPRVAAQFSRARDLGLRIVAEALEADFVRTRLVSRAAHFVCLLDLRWIACLDCGTPHRALQFSFAGHFVVLHSYDVASCCVGFMDPAAPCRACRMPWADFARAWASDGTDSDAIEVSVPPGASLPAT